MLSDFVKLYKKSIPIHNLVNEDNENFKCFSMKNGLPVGMVFVKDCIELLYPLKRFYKYFEENPCFWMIPLATPSKKIIGFVIRGYNRKEYRTIFDYSEENLSPLFGWEDFNDFKADTPVIICEGVKDAIWLKQYYKYTLALNGSEITSSNLEIFKNIFNKVILCYDNDDNLVGEKSANKDKDTFSGMGVICKTIYPPNKDCAMFIENEKGLEDFLNTLKTNIEILGGSCEINKK